MFLCVKMSNVFFGNFTCVISMLHFPLQLLLGPPPPCLLLTSSLLSPPPSAPPPRPRHPS